MIITQSKYRTVTYKGRIADIIECTYDSNHTQIVWLHPFALTDRWNGLGQGGGTCHKVGTIELVQQGHKSEGINRTQTKRFYTFVFNGKEKDYESGFHYYGARYYWSEVLTGWLSVDPMMDMYPGISPYCYCMWNPVVLVNPDGNFPWDVHVKIVSDALNNKRFDSYATNIILFGTGIFADWVLFSFSNVHLDNKSGFANIAELYSGAISKAISHLSNGNYLRAGKNLHTIADFYSHSNYVDLYGQYATEKGLTMDPELIPTFTDMMNNVDFGKMIPIAK